MSVPTIRYIIVLQAATKFAGMFLVHLTVIVNQDTQQATVTTNVKVN